MKIFVKGFTLIELIYSMILLGMIGTTVMMIVNQPIKNYILKNKQLNILYQSDLVFYHIEKKIDKKSASDLKIVNKDKLFINEDHYYHCKNNNLWLYFENNEHLLAKNTQCSFKMNEARSKVDILLYYRIFNNDFLLQRTLQLSD